MRFMIDSIFVLLGFLVSVSGQNCSLCPSTVTLPGPSYPRCDQSVECYPYSTFVVFYEDNLYSQYKMLGDACFALIIIHITLCPMLLIMLVLFRTRNGDYMAVSRRLCSTRKSLIWFSGIPICLFEVVLFLWAPLTTIVYLTFFLHIIGVIIGLFTLFRTIGMSASEVLRKKGGTLTPISAHIVVDAYCLKNMIVLDKRCVEDKGANHDKFVAHICVPDITDSGVFLSKNRFLGNGSTQTAALDSAYSRLDGYWSDLPGYQTIKVAIATSSHHAVNVGSSYEEGLDTPVNYEHSISRSPPYSDNSSTRAVHVEMGNRFQG